MSFAHRRVRNFRSNRSRPAAIEPLESRQLLSVSLNNGLLSVVGSNNNDQIILSVDPRNARLIDVSINGRVIAFNSRSVTSIRVLGLGGNDTIAVDERNGRLFTPLSVDGGAGNDTITAGSGNALILGGSGNDVLRGGRGNDQIYGDAGNDSIFGGSGNDTLGGDNQDLFPFKGQSPLVATPGNDLIVCGSGNDWVVGGNESDTLHDQPNGRDTIVSGTGRDILDPRTRFTYDSHGKATADSSTQDTILKRKPGDIVPQEDFHAPATQYAVHIHAVLRIWINDGAGLHEVNIPAGIGDFGQAPTVHTHSNTGIIHMHDIVKRQFTLGEFFRNWGVSLSSANIGRYRADSTHSLTMTVNGKQVSGFQNYVIRDNDLITIRYNTTGGANANFPPVYPD